MSGDNDNNGGNTLGGGPSEPLPPSWASRSSQPRVGRIGDWSGSSNASSGYVIPVLYRILTRSLIRKIVICVSGRSSSKHHRRPSAFSVWQHVVTGRQEKADSGHWGQWVPTTTEMMMMKMTKVKEEKPISQEVIAGRPRDAACAYVVPESY